MPRELTVRVSGRTVLWTLLILASVWMIIALHNVLVLFFVAVLFSVAISGVVDWLEQYGVARSISILILYVIIILLLVGMGFLVVPLVGQQLTILRARFPNLVQQPLQQGSAWIAERFPDLRDTLPTGDLASQAARQVATLIGGVGDTAIRWGRAFIGFVLNLIVVMVLGFFLVSRPNVAQRFIRLFIPPSHQERLINVTSVIGRRLGRWVWAQLTIASFYAVSFGIGLWILGVPYPVALGVVGGLLELIPYVGGFIATIVTMLVAFTVNPSLAISVLILHLVIGNIQVHVLAPKLMGHAVETHPVITILALFSGIELLGIVGGIIAIPLAVVGQALVEEFWIKRNDPSYGNEPDPVVRKPSLWQRFVKRRKTIG